MNIRRPMAGLFVALALLGGPATLTACSASGDGANDGTTDDDSTNTSGNDPAGTSQGNLPDNNDGTGTGSRDEGEDSENGG